MIFAFIVLTCYFMISFLFLRQGRSGVIKAQLPFFLALGFTCYSFFRFGLLSTFNENQAWADWWEESTEFIMIAMVVLLLVVFKKQLELESTWLYKKFKFLHV